MPTRRDFLKQAAAVTTLAMAGLDRIAAAAGPATAPIPWYRRTSRWGQTNITEADVVNYDIPWWRQHWKRTRVQGVIINAGGIFAYYPSRYPLHYRPPLLAGRDLYGELAQAAHDHGLCVIARMDSSKGHADLYRAHPDWFGCDATGEAYRSGEFYLTCINTPYYSEYLPGILREIIERSHPQGIADNIWSGLERSQICHCKYCVSKFHDATGKDIPNVANWNDPVYRQWNEWNYTLRTQQWDFNNTVTTTAGGADCLWIGMSSTGMAGLGGDFRDVKELCARAEFYLLDNQSRTDASGFGENALGGKSVHQLLGWDKLASESMAMYQHGRPQFRMSAKSAPEARLWMQSGFAGGVGPWWHHVGASSEDRRAYNTAEPVMQFHEQNEPYLHDRTPIATVAVAYSRLNANYYGRDNSEELVAQPWRGFTQALVRGRIPFMPMHLDYLERDGAALSVLILPNLGALSDAQLAALHSFVQRGGSLIATGQSSLFNEVGDARADFGLADLFGVQGGKPLTSPPQPLHTYLRLPAGAGRHPILAGFEQTDILPYGGTLAPLTLTTGKALATYIPPFPSTPPEIVWMRQPRTDIPGMIVNESLPGRVVFIPADLDRRFALNNFPDHGDLLAGAVRWAARDTIPLRVAGSGLINCELYRQDRRLILHILNMTNAGTWRSPVDELIPIGPLQIQVRSDAAPTAVTSLVTGRSVKAGFETGWIKFEGSTILDHEVVVIET